MRKFIAIVGAALLGAAACSSHNSPSSITAPSQLSATTASGATVSPLTACPKCSFTATQSSYASWSGTTTPTSAPTNGHPGNLTMTFSPPLKVGAVLAWSGFNTGAHATCTIKSNPKDHDWATDTVTVPCDDGNTLLVHPIVSPTTFTFTDTKNNPPSQDDVQTMSVSVTVDTTANVTATWVSNFGSGDADASYTYTGTVSGPHNALSVNATSPTRCGLGGGGAANTFSAVMDILDLTHITGTYHGLACTIDTGTFSVTAH